jgi:N-acetylneuraminic acid mutarotase
MMVIFTFGVLIGWLISTNRFAPNFKEIGPVSVTRMNDWKKLDIRPYDHSTGLYHSCHTSHVISNNLVVFLGEEHSETESTDAVFIYNIKELTELKVRHKIAPLERRSHASVCIGKKVYLFGGDAWPLRNDLWCYDFEGSGSPKYIQADGELPKGRRYHVMAHHSGYLYVFGGEIGTGGQGSVHDFHRHDILKNTWKKIHTKESPPARRYSTLETVKDTLWLFGGRNPINRFNDLWRFDVKCMEWCEIAYSNGSFPCPRAAVTSCVIDSSIYYFGGNRDVGGPCNELWEFQTETYTWRVLNIPNQEDCVPIPRYWHSMCVSAKNEIFVTGGHDLSQQHNLNDFWVISPHVKRQYIQVEIMKSGFKFTNVIFKLES